VAGPSRIAGTPANFSVSTRLVGSGMVAAATPLTVLLHEVSRKRASGPGSGDGLAAGRFGVGSHRARWPPRPSVVGIIVVVPLVEAQGGK